MQPDLTAEISASAVETNLTLMRSLLPDRTRLCAAVKADCYGHGLEILLETISLNSDWLAVATGGEAMQLRRLGYTGPVLMFFAPAGLGDAESLADLIAAEATLTIVSPADVQAVAQAAGRAGRVADVHVMIDTGMHRSGVPDHLAPELVRTVRAETSIRLTGLYTHFAAADEADKTSANQQADRFDAAVAACGGPDGLLLHAANSSALIDMPRTHLDMARPGISVYGYQPSDRMHRRLPLRPALRLTGPLMQIKDVPAASRCGYGLTHQFDRPSRIGLVPIGYADGYLRSHSNRTVMRVAGRQVPVVGRVSMDQTIIDVTDAPAAKLGDEVEIISTDPDAPHSVESLARLAGTIPHEVTTRLGSRVRRVSVP